MIYQYPQLSGIKSLQYGSIAITGTNTTNTATISSVDTNKAVLHFLGFYSAAKDEVMTAQSITLTNATTVTATRGTPTGAGGTSTVSFVVEERY